MKHLLEQKVGTSLQQKWVAKLLGYDFLVEYKQGRDNKVADALSRKFEELEGVEQGELKAISFLIATWLADLRQAYLTDTHLQDLLAKLQEGKLDPLKYKLVNGLMYYKGRIYIGDDLALKERILQLVHDSPLGRHAGYEKSYQRAKKDFYWQGMKQDIKIYIKQCQI